MENYNKIHKENKFDSSLEHTELTRAYSVAENKLKPKPYAERKFKIKENIVKVRGFYPYLSVLLSLSVGVMAGDLFASGLNEVGYYLTIAGLAVIVFLIAWLLEDLKRDACRDFFSSTKPSGKQRFWLNSLFMYSVIISGIGGYVASIHLNDRTTEIEQNYQVQSDSINTGYGEQIAVLNSIINENKKRMQSSSKWTRYHAQKDLAEAQGTKTELLKLQNNTLSEIKTEKKAELTNGNLINQYKAYVIVLVVLLLESLYIRSFAYEYAVERKIKTENRNLKIIPVDDNDTFSAPLTIQDIAMQMLLSNITANSSNVLPEINIPKNNQENIAGFKFNNPDKKKAEPSKTEKKSNVNTQFDAVKPTCANPNCNNKFERTHWNKKYCSDACRLENWQTKNKGRRNLK